MKAITYADERTRISTAVGSRTTCADALHAKGCRAEAEALFDEAEGRQQSMHPSYPLLYSQAGYHYCELLLAECDWGNVLDRAMRTLQWAEKHAYPRDIALDLLSLGRATWGVALENRKNGLKKLIWRSSPWQAFKHLNRAVDQLRGVGEVKYLACGFLARAKFRRSVGDWEGAARDLDEVFEIAEPGPMRLFLCDLALERARLALAQIEAFAPLHGMLEKGSPAKPQVPGLEECTRLKAEAAAQIKTAADYIATCGYHRRDEELAELQDVLAGSAKFADLPPRV